MLHRMPAWRHTCCLHLRGGALAVVLMGINCFDCGLRPFAHKPDAAQITHAHRCGPACHPYAATTLSPPRRYLLTHCGPHRALLLQIDPTCLPRPAGAAAGRQRDREAEGDRDLGLAQEASSDVDAAVVGSLLYLACATRPDLTYTAPVAAHSKGGPAQRTPLPAEAATTMQRGPTPPTCEGSQLQPAGHGGAGRHRRNAFQHRGPSGLLLQ